MSTLWTRLKKATIHPLLFAVFPVVSLYVRNMGEGFLLEAVRIGAAAFLVAALFWFVVDLFMKEKRRSALVVSAFFVLFFSYGHAMSVFRALFEMVGVLKDIRFLVEGRLALRLWLVSWVMLFFAAVIIITRVKRDLRPVTRFLNVVALALLLVVGATFAYNGADVFLVPRLRTSKASAGGTSKPDADSLDPGKGEESEAGAERAAAFGRSWQPELSVEARDLETGSLPDVYYIVVDAYARADILEEVYGIDNSEFLSYLSGQGFYVADKSVSNYPQTALSLASSLNFTYLDDLASEMGTQTDNRQPLQVMIKESRTFRYFEKLGYTTLACRSGYGFTELTDADVYMKPPKQWALSEFQEALVTLTPLSVFRKTWFDFRRDRITYALDHVADAAGYDEPTFTFVHVLVPHWPFIFDARGHPVQPPKGIGMRTDYEYDQFLEGYRGQLAFVNERLKSAIDEILSRSSSAPIIIIQADHGPDAKLDLGWDIDDTYLPERMSILNAYYFPDQGYDELYASITPVNTFRVVLNKLGGANYELLEDRSYFASWSQPYLFVDVTDEVLPGIAR